MLPPALLPVVVEAKSCAPVNFNKPSTGTDVRIWIKINDAHAKLDGEKAKKNLKNHLFEGPKTPQNPFKIRQNGQERGGYPEPITKYIKKRVEH